VLNIASERIINNKHSRCRVSREVIHELYI
jgi:hypothetical protein